MWHVHALPRLHYGHDDDQETRVNVSSTAREASLRWRVVALCFLAQNCAMGFAFGSFGPMLASSEQHFGVSRTVASTGMSLIMLAIGGLSPMLGSLLQRASVRHAMIAGALLSAIGYWGLSLLQSFQLALVMYAFIGVGVCLVAILGPLILISRWFDENRAKMLSVVNLPIVLFVTPYLVGLALPVHGRFGMLAAMGTVFLLLAPTFLLLTEYPPAKVPQPGAAADAADASAADNAAEILKRPAFWLLSIGIGIMAGAGTGFVVHIVPFGVEKQMSLTAASALLSAYSGAGIFGTLLFGWVADRIGPPAALMISAFCQALLWWGMLQVHGAPLYLVAALLGICVVPLVTLHGAAVSKMFGAARVARAMGYSYSVKLPFIFGFAPAMGWMFDAFGHYRAPFLTTAGLMALSCASFYLMLLSLRKQGGVTARLQAGS
jgi:cyanate permease